MEVQAPGALGADLGMRQPGHVGKPAGRPHHLLMEGCTA
jgi:hypothetical protein